MLKSMLSDNSKELLQEAVFEELNASSMYLYLSNQCQRLGFFGAAKFFKRESDSEREHYLIHAEFMNARGDVADIPATDAFSDKMDSLNEVVRAAFHSEVALGKKYTAWYKQAHVNDPTIAQHLLQFIEFQTKSIGEYGDLLQRIAISGGDECAMLIIDKEMGG